MLVKNILAVRGSENAPLPSSAAKQLLLLLCDPWPIDITLYQCVGPVYIWGCTAKLAETISRPVEIDVWRIICEPGSDQYTEAKSIKFNYLSQ